MCGGGHLCRLAIYLDAIFLRGKVGILQEVESLQGPQRSAGIDSRGAGYAADLAGSDIELVRQRRDGLYGPFFEGAIVVEIRSLHFEGPLSHSDALRLGDDVEFCVFRLQAG